MVTDERNTDAINHPHPNNLNTTRYRTLKKVKVAIMLSGVDLNCHKRQEAQGTLQRFLYHGKGKLPINTTELLMMMNNFLQQETTKHGEGCECHEGMKTG